MEQSAGCLPPRSVHGETSGVIILKTAVHGELAGLDGRSEGESRADAAAFLVRGHHGDGPHAAQRLNRGPQTRSLDSIVVGKEDFQGLVIVDRGLPKSGSANPSFQS